MKSPLAELNMRYFNSANGYLQNKYLSFIDDLKLFKNKNVINKFVKKSIDNGCVKMKNIEIYLSEGEIESIYLLSSNK